MFNSIGGDPRIERDLVEERQRELLQEVERDRVAAGQRVEKEDFQPLTDDAGDLVDSADDNLHIHDDEAPHGNLGE